jgi:eukaryotic-like serine/threonine-protein kinase
MGDNGPLPMKSMPQHLGTRNRFELVRKLGEGGMGAVYEALDRERGERIALKLVAEGDATRLQRFKQEFRALQDLEHPNLVRIGELHEADGDWFITMELVPGTDLLSYVCEDGQPYDEARLRASFQQLAVGLRALHVAGKVHRDIKPSNVRVTPEGRVVVLDFGLVIDRSVARMSTEGNVVGSVAYMAPEQASAAPIEAAADWYAFGVVLHEALTGAVPFGGNKLQVLMDKLRITPPPPRARVPSVPEDLDELCVELLRADPATRPRGDEVLRRLGVSVGPNQTGASSSVSLHSDASTFVGRAAESDELDRAFAEVRRGAALTVWSRGLRGSARARW